MSIALINTEEKVSIRGEKPHAGKNFASRLIEVSEKFRKVNQFVNFALHIKTLQDKQE